MKSVLLIVGIGVLVLAPRFAGAQTPSIDHQAVACAVAEKFPRLEARFAPADTVAVARVLFQAENGQQWYAVAMKAEGLAFSGVLPKPKKSLKTFKYYIEVTDKALGTSRTADYTTNVVGSSAECKGKLMAGALGSASVLLQVPAGAAALPAGFASTGVVAAGSGSTAAATSAAAGGGGGGLGTGAVVGIVAGAGAAAAGVLVVAGKSDEGSSATYSGSLSGQYVLSQTVTGPGPGSYTCLYTRAVSGRMTLTLNQSNGTATGPAETTITATAAGVSGGPMCTSGQGPGGGQDFTCTVTGTPANLTCSQQISGSIQGLSNTWTFGFSGALSGGVISGTVAYGYSGQGNGFNTGPFMTTHNGSTTFPVTLR